MTVKELISELLKCKMSAEIYLSMTPDIKTNNIHDIRQVRNDDNIVLIRNWKKGDKKRDTINSGKKS